MWQKSNENEKTRQPWIIYGKMKMVHWTQNEKLSIFEI